MRQKAFSTFFLAAALVAGAAALVAGAALASAQTDAKPRPLHSFRVSGAFDSYVTTEKGLEYLLVDTSGPGVCSKSGGCVQTVELQAISCSEGDPTGCDLLESGDRVLVAGELESASVCDEGSGAVRYYNRLLPIVVWRCDGGVCSNLAR